MLVLQVWYSKQTQKHGSRSTEAEAEARLGAAAVALEKGVVAAGVLAHSVGVVAPSMNVTGGNWMPSCLATL